MFSSIKGRGVSGSGFSLIEVLVSLAIFSVVSAVMAPSFIGHMKRNVSTEQRNGAFAAAQAVLEETRSLDPGTLPLSGNSGYQNVQAGERTYRVITYYCPVATYCTPRSRHLKVTVSYRNEELFSVETIFTRLR